MRHPVERAQKIVDRLYERNTRLKFEAIEKNDSVLIYIKNEDNESIGVIEVPDNVNDLCKYYPGIGWLVSCMLLTTPCSACPRLVLLRQILGTHERNSRRSTTHGL